MRVIYTKNYEDMSKKTANLISAKMMLDPKINLGLATGSSPLGTYKNLIEKYNNGDIDFSNVKAANLDEYCGLGKDHDQSYAYFMRENLFNHTNINLENTYIPNGLTKNADEECKNYDAKIAEIGGIDLQLLGIGHNGHIGFNEPSDVFEKGTHHVDLTQATVDANAQYFESADEMPKTAYTMGIKTIMNSKSIVLIASGSAKSDILYQVITGEITPNVPASVLQLHTDVTIVADKDALSKTIENAPHLIENFSK